MQYLYLIKCQQFYKIGIANDVESRLAQLSTGNPFELEVLAVYGFDNASSVESAIHQRFANNRGRGEWFGLSDKELNDIKNICIMLGGINDELPTVDNEEIEGAEEMQDAINENHFHFNCDTDGNHYVYGLHENRREPNGRKSRVYKWKMDDPRTQEFCKAEAERWLLNHKCKRNNGIHVSAVTSLEAEAK